MFITYKKKTNDSVKMSSHTKLIHFLNQQNLMINDDGIIKMNHQYHYLFLSCLYLMICMMISLKSQIYTICLYSTSIYSKFAEHILKLNDVFYINLTKPYLTTQCYETSQNELVCITPQADDFANTVVDLIPLSHDELKALEKHTGLTNLASVQDKILNLCPAINAHQIINDHNHHYINYDLTKNKNCIDVVTTNKTYKTNLILTDYTTDLKPGDILNLSYYSHIDERIFIENKYIVNKQYKLEVLSEEVKNNIDILPFYSLETPRPQLVFHPYHLPKTADFMMSIMIVTQAILDLL
jgi:hypothetical protein